MINIKIIFTVVFCCFTFSFYEAEARVRNNGGGTVVGNGAGSVESNFQYAYQSLQKIVPNCLESKECDTTADEKVILEKINTIVINNSNKKDRLKFVSEKEHPGFFTTGSGESYRIAKTYLTSDAPIFVNTDLLYKDNGMPALNFPDILRILIHELGHQTGILDHSVLDIVGTKVAMFSEVHTNYYHYKIDDEQKLIVSVTNIQSPQKSSVVIFNWNDSAANLTDLISFASECKFLNENFKGLEIVNGHYSINAQGNLLFEAWVNVSCHQSKTFKTFVYKRDLSITLDENFQINGIQIK